MDILNLPNLELVSVDDTEDAIRITAKPKAPAYCCQKCGIVREHNLSRFGSKTQVYMDIPVRGKRVAVQVKRQRYTCRDCNQTFFEILPDMHDKHFATSRLVDYIEKQSLIRSFTSVADDVGIDEKLVRNIFNDLINRLNANYKPQFSNWVGIDEIFLIKRPRCVITDIGNRTVIDLLPDRNKQSVIDYFVGKVSRRGIEYVTMDMWRPYKDAVNFMCPDAKIIVDKFHVVKMANKALEDIRKSIRVNLTAKERRSLMRSRFVLLRRQSQLSEKDVETLDEWTKTFPGLSNAYTLKEMFFDIWSSNSKYDAIQQYNAWLSLVTEDVFPAFRDLITAMSNWHDEVFNYFDMPLTNAYTEGLNGLIRHIEGQGRGYSFDVIRAKLLMTQGFVKEARPKFQKYPNAMSFITMDDTDYSLDDIGFSPFPLDTKFINNRFSTQPIKVELVKGKLVSTGYSE